MNDLWLRNSVLATDKQYEQSWVVEKSNLRG